MVLLAGFHMNKIIVSVKGNLSKFIKKCIDYSIDISNINYISDEEATVKINLEDYKKIKKVNYFCKFKIIKYEGLLGFKKNIKENIYIYILFLLCFILMDILSSYIVRIDVIHENKRVRELVSRELYDHGIKKYSLAYSFDELEKIKNDVLKDNTDVLEWMSITRVGMTYVVRIEERIIKEKDKNSGSRDIVALKDALITKVISSKGEPLVRSGDYVKKGDVLISGKIKLYDEVKGNTSATGTVYGNVWYETEIKIPMVKEVTNDTGKKRYNININDKIFLKNKYKYFRQENVKELKILGFKIKIYKEVEYNKKIVKLTEKDVDKEMEKQISKAFQEKLNGNGSLISQKVLKKERNNSTIDYRVFVITNEIISDYVYFEAGDESDTTKSN